MQTKGTQREGEDRTRDGKEKGKIEFGNKENCRNGRHEKGRNVPEAPAFSQCDSCQAGTCGVRSCRMAAAHDSKVWIGSRTSERSSRHMLSTMRPMQWMPDACSRPCSSIRLWSPLATCTNHESAFRIPLFMQLKSRTRVSRLVAHALAMHPFKFKVWSKSIVMQPTGKHLHRKPRFKLFQS